MQRRAHAFHQRQDVRILRLRRRRGLRYHLQQGPGNASRGSRAR
jgi:hypothetical protein